MLADNLLRRRVWSGGDSSGEQRAEGGSAVLCLLFEGTAVGACAACVLSVVMIGVDQYFAVIDPLRYHAFIKATTSVLMMAVSWAIAAVLSVLGGFSANRGCAWYACESLADDAWPLRLPDGYRLTFAGLFVAFAFVAPFTAICWIYLSICTAAHQNHKRATRHGSAASCGLTAAAAVAQEATLLEYASTVREYVDFDDVATDDDGGSPRRIRCQTPPPPPPLPSADSPSKPLHHSSTKGSLKSTSSSIVNSLRHRISNASMFRYREETRAARISALVIVMALFCWLPFTLVLVARSPLLLAHLELPHYIKQMGILSLSSNAVVSPLIFAHRNRRIHRELCRLFRVSRRRASFYSGDAKHSARRQRDSLGGGSGKGKRRPFLDPPAAAANAPSSDGGPWQANKAAVVSPADGGAGGATRRPGNLLGERRRVSILNRLWRVSSEVNRERRHRPFRLPEVAFETDTSRSSFSSNASTGSHHRSTSLASVSDALAAEER